MAKMARTITRTLVGAEPAGLITVSWLNNQIREIWERAEWEKEGCVLGLYVLDEDGNPVPEKDTLTWARWFETADRRVAFTDMGPLGAVSTVFLGVGVEEGKLFETQFFAPDRRSGLCLRYHTRTEALKGHENMVQAVKENAEEALDDALEEIP